MAFCTISISFAPKASRPVPSQVISLHTEVAPVLAQVS